MLHKDRQGRSWHRRAESAWAVSKGPQERKAQLDRGKVRSGHIGGASLGSWGGGLGGRSLELPNKMLF